MQWPETLKNEVCEYLKSRMVPFGIMVVELSITDFEFSLEFETLNIEDVPQIAAEAFSGSRSEQLAYIQLAP